LSEIKGVKVVILRMSAINVIDGSGAQALLEIVKELNKGGITVVFEGLNSDVRTVLDRVLGNFKSVDHFVDAMNLARSLSRGSS
jgi:SulP family sulfate permease